MDLLANALRQASASGLNRILLSRPSAVCGLPYAFAACVLLTLCGCARSPVAQLAKQLNDNDPKVRYEAAQALEEYGPEAKPAVPRLAELLSDDEPKIRYRAAKALRKDLSGRYHSRSLNLPMSDAIRVRSAAIQASVNAFDPDVLIVDKVPRGIADELMPTLDSLRRRGRTRCVLGLRDVLDEKSAVLRDWRAARTLDVIRQHFDEVWVYGDAGVFDFVNEYDVPDDVAAKVRYTGYLDQSQRAEFDAESPESSCIADFSHERFNLCLVGGGQDGVSLATAFSEAVRQTDLPAVLLTGPYMPSNARQELLRGAAICPNWKVLEFVPEADWLMSRAARVVAMGGYNTASSILSFGKPAPSSWDLVDINGLANIRRLVEKLVCRKLEHRSK